MHCDHELTNIQKETMQEERLVRLSLRGSVFLLSTTTFDSHPESLLAKAFADSMQMRPTSLMDGDAHFSPTTRTTVGDYSIE